MTELEPVGKRYTGPVRPETDRLESYAQPVKFRQKPLKFR
jgi:hypothetical protein